MLPKIAFVLLLIQSALVYGQVSDAEMETLKSKWRVDLRKKARDLSSERPSQDGMSVFSDSIHRLFSEDTFVVENLLDKQLQKDPTTLGMNKANLACAAEYEQLIDSYYAILLGKMKGEDKELLISWQNAWKALMEKERSLIGKLMQEEYSGGGSIQSLNYTSRLMNEQKAHLLVIIDYLTHLI